MLIIWLCEDSKNIVNNGILGEGGHKASRANADLCAIFEDICGVKKPDLRLVWQIMQGPRTHGFYNTLTLNNLKKVSVRGPNF